MLRYRVESTEGKTVYAGNSSKESIRAAQNEGTAVLSAVTGKPLYSDFVYSEYDGCWICTRYDGEIIKLR